MLALVRRSRGFHRRATEQQQRRRIEAAGGLNAIVAGGNKIPYTPAPEEFNPVYKGAHVS